MEKILIRREDFYHALEHDIKPVSKASFLFSAKGKGKSSNVIGFSGVSVSTDHRRNASATLLREVGYSTFSSEEQATSLNNVMDKNIICSRGNACNLV